MQLTPGTRLGPYEILVLIGVGGMGEVYKARDTRLDRIVAVKISSERFSERFEREARAVASLNHPNICTLHDVGPEYLVMEYIEGTPLKGPLPLGKALDYACQILDALDAAHRKGITHRDLKPGNILVTKSGLKLLDFGLAQIAHPVMPPSEATVTMALTGKNEVLGTLYYMSPEQLQAPATGQKIDSRTDIFSFGVVLYEMLTGNPPFRGSSPASVIAAIMERPAPSIKGVAPAAVDRVLKTCLAKEPDERWQTARDLKRELHWIASSPADSGLVPFTLKLPQLLPWILAGVLAGALGATSWYAWRALQPAEPKRLMRLELDLGAEAIRSSTSAANMAAISADGTRLVYSVRTSDGKQVLATRLLAKPNATVLSGTEDGVDPFFSPDGQWIGFFSGRKLKKVATIGGAPIALADAVNARGASWGEEGTIVAALTNTAGLVRIPASGGTPQPLTELRPGEYTHRWPQVVSGGKAVLFTVSTNLSAYENSTIEVVSIKTGERTVLHSGGYFGRAVGSGHLLYIHEGTLFAALLDSSLRKLRSTSVPVLDDIAADPSSGAGGFDVSRTGTFVYRAGKPTSLLWPLLSVDRTGKVQTILKPGAYFTPRFSPDGRRLAIGIETGRGRDLSIYDLQRESLTRLTFSGPVTYYPVWTPDGAHIALMSTTASGFSITWVRADGAAGVQKILEQKNLIQPVSFSPDGRLLAYHERSADKLNYDLWTVSLDVTDPDHPKPGKPELLLGTPANEMDPTFSPDGRWLAYTSDESGTYEVYVRPFPGGGGRWQTSAGGGKSPVWSRDGRSILYQSTDNRIMVAEYTASGASFLTSRPRVWFDQLFNPTFDFNFDVAPDGMRVVTLGAPSTERVRLTFLLNLFDELQRNAPLSGK